MNILSSLLSKNVKRLLSGPVLIKIELVKLTKRPIGGSIASLVIAHAISRGAGLGLVKKLTPNPDPIFA